MTEPHDDDALTSPATASSRARGIALGVVILLAALLVIGGVGKISGTGWFAYRAILYNPGQLYVINLDAPDRFITFDGSRREELPFDSAQPFDLVGGTTEVVIQDAQSLPLATHAVKLDGQNAVLKLGADLCLVTLDISGFYGVGQDKKFKVARRITADDQLIILDSTNVIWPRHNFPKRMTPGQGPALWIEKVACALLDPADEPLLLGYMEQRFNDRVKKLQEPAKSVAPTL